MKNLRKLLAVALVAAMVLSLAACGSSSSDDSAEETYKIGGIGPTTGGASVYGLAVQYGAQSL